MFDNIVTVYRNSADVWFYVSSAVDKCQLATPHPPLGRRAAGLDRSTHAEQRPPSRAPLGVAAPRPPARTDVACAAPP